ncbi:Pxd [Bugula neritina]|uniref:Pxd n=1 Tax=Bugula neritina TaxID=10212 RepID=A0A7J7JT30_BUGNE|nr:Pxd [Bugula neritina]
MCFDILEQLQEIRKISLAAIYCDNVPGAQVRRKLFLLKSSSNPTINCKNIPRIDLTKWRADSYGGSNIRNTDQLNQQLDQHSNTRKRQQQTQSRRRQNGRRRQNRKLNGILLTS